MILQKAFRYVFLTNENYQISSISHAQTRATHFVCQTIGHGFGTGSNPIGVYLIGCPQSAKRNKAEEASKNTWVCSPIPSVFSPPQPILAILRQWQPFSSRKPPVDMFSGSCNPPSTLANWKCPAAVGWVGCPRSHVLPPQSQCHVNAIFSTGFPPTPNKTAPHKMACDEGNGKSFQIYATFLHSHSSTILPF